MSCYCYMYLFTSQKNLLIYEQIIIHSLIHVRVLSFDCAFRHGVPFRSRKIVSFHSLGVSFYTRLCFCNFCHTSLLLRLLINLLPQKIESNFEQLLDFGATFEQLFGKIGANFWENRSNLWTALIIVVVIGIIVIVIITYFNF